MHHAEEDDRSGGHDGTDRIGAISDPEVWMDHWSEELVILWHGLQEHSQMMGTSILDRCDFPNFAQFCWEHSSRRPPAA